MELSILEKVRKDREGKEAHEAKGPLEITYPDGGKGKIPMEDIPQVTVAQQLKAILQTSQQLKQKLANMT